MRPPLAKGGIEVRPWPTRSLVSALGVLSLFLLCGPRSVDPPHNEVTGQGAQTMVIEAEIVHCHGNMAATTGRAIARRALHVKSTGNTLVSFAIIRGKGG